MHLQRLVVGSFRNIASAELRFSPGLNVISGPNGSGKTSLLEAIYMLATTRSFRTSRAGSVVKFDEEELNVFGEVQLAQRLLRVGVSRDRRGRLRARVDGEAVERSSQLASDIPVTIISPETLDLVSGSPELRRRCLDWGVFHVKPELRVQWSRMRRALRHRNALLRQGATTAVLSAWDQSWVDAARQIDDARQAYVQDLVAVASLAEVSEALQIGCSVSAGWPDRKPLFDVLRETEDRDRKSGFTSAGPHRADLVLRSGGRAAAEVLSRGQRKRFSLSFRLAQIGQLAQEKGLSAIVLIDDLRAELDEAASTDVVKAVRTLGSQCFLTTLTAPEAFATAPDDRLFHVEHGRFTARDGPLG